MRSKKTLLTLVFFSLLILSLFPLVSAQTVTETIVGGITDGINFIQEAGKPIFGSLLGSTTDGGDLFTKILFFHNRNTDCNGSPRTS